MIIYDYYIYIYIAGIASISKLQAWIQENQKPENSFQITFSCIFISIGPFQFNSNQQLDVIGS